MSNLARQPLLITQSRSLTFIERGSTFVVEEFPAWLAGDTGREPEEWKGLDVIELEKIIPGIAELLRRTSESDQSVKGFKTGFVDYSGHKHQLLLDTIIDEGRSDPRVIEVVIQEIPVEFLSPQVPRESLFCGLVGRSEAMQNVFNKIRMYAVSEAPVLITGETGAGKEGVAAALHQLSRRNKGPFVTMNCSAITETLFESELFGHEKGSFTGAVKNHRGRFERADRGTLFLDEIGDLPLASQAKLLRVLETSQIEKVGGEKPVPVDVRILAATNHDLEANSFARTFRSDLFYRINALQIRIPPLRQRPEDIEPLIQHFIGILNQKYGRKVVCLTREALQLLRQYQWPGNVRELRNLMERLFAENQTEVIGLRALREWYEERQLAGRNSGAAVPEIRNVTVLPYREAIPLGMPVNDFNRNHTEPAGSQIGVAELRQAYCQASGNITRAAEILGIHKATFYRHLKNFNLSREDLESGSGL
ncbi:MAG: sigma-54 dependent transcriptional regulator [Candidatus Riflebacteria bacterium]